ncbi:MAG: hypothetical protein P8H61_11025, partial [Ilumatobacter sp.]|nr:hypothetical protein [Ilumatobacter sp.]
MTDTAIDSSNGSDHDESEGVIRRVLARIDTTNAVVLPLLAFFSALVIGVFVIALSDIDKLREG